MSLTLWQIILLAIVQGVTEFLPVSSSGHLVIVAGLLNCKTDVADLVVTLHIGTLFSILVFYRQRILRLLGEDRRLIPLLIVGTLPAVLVGLTVKVAFKHLLESPLLSGCLLLVTGIVLLLLPWVKKREGEYQKMSLGQALLIGSSQAIAVLPGLSRSGLTISSGLASGLSPRSAATFSFLLAIPVIAGAGLLEAVSMVSKGTMATPLSYLAVGMVVSFVTGLLSLWWLVSWLEKGRLQWFGWWCIPVGLLVICSYSFGWLQL